jgi:hypothetical protein
LLTDHRVLEEAFAHESADGFTDRNRANPAILFLEWDKAGGAEHGHGVGRNVPVEAEGDEGAEVAKEVT